MVLQVGDNVLVYGAGTPWAYAKKIEPLNVGDEVDVVTLSDGTKLAMPKINLDLNDYVWVFPEWDIPFNIDDIPYRWGTIPLGACVFTVTGTGVNLVIDENREWEPGSLAGCYIVFVSGKLKGGALYILSNSETSYTVSPMESPPVTWKLIATPFGGAENISCSGSGVHVGQHVPYSLFQANDPVPLVGKYARYAYEGLGTDDYGSQSRLYNGILPDGDVLGWYFGPYNWLVWNRPIYTPTTKTGGGETTVVNNEFYPTMIVFSTGSDVYDEWGNLLYEAHFDLFYLTYQDVEDCADDVEIGDKYIIYNPETGRLMFNDATKTVLSAASWRAVNYPGEIVSIAPVEYVWDGAGAVYLTQSKTTNSTIFYDNELRVEAFGDTGDVRAIDYHTHDEYTYSGETVSRELVNITSILRAGKNYVKLYARDTGGTAVGFPTPIYIKRDMA